MSLAQVALITLAMIAAIIAVQYDWKKLRKPKTRKTYDVGKLFIAIAYIEDAEGTVGHAAVEIKGYVGDPEERWGFIEKANSAAASKIERWFKKGFINIEHKGCTEIIPISKVVSMTVDEPTSYIVDEDDKEVTNG